MDKYNYIPKELQGKIDKKILAKMEEDFRTGRIFRQQNANIIARQRAIKNNISMEEIKQRIDKETLFLFAFVPFVIAEVAWDFADTCIDIAIILRLTPTKKLCRRIRELRKEYDFKRSRFIDNAHRDLETDNMIAFQEDYKEYFSTLVKSINDQVDTQHPGLEYQSRLLISGAYSCAVVLRALFDYASFMERKIADLLGIDSTGSIIIPELRELEKIILQFAGEESINNDNRFPSTLAPFVTTLTDYMKQSEIIDLPSPI